MNIAMMRSSSILEFHPSPFAIRECAGALCLALIPPLFSVVWFFSLTILL